MKVYDFKGVHFLPYIGGNYEESNPKIMFLGESHYSKDEGQEKTRNVIDRYVDGKENYRFINGMLRAVYGISGTIPNKKEMCEKICFYNYIQEIVGETAGIRPTEEQWDNAKKPFLEVVSKLDPDITICCGKSLYNHLPLSSELGPKKEDLSKDKLWLMKDVYNINGKEILLYAMKHPSSIGFNAEKYYDLLRSHMSIS